jgi:hypothetical protein
VYSYLYFGVDLELFRILIYCRVGKMDYCTGFTYSDEGGHFGDQWLQEGGGERDCGRAGGDGCAGGGVV